MTGFEHERHKPLAPLHLPRELIVACPQMQSNVNVSRIVRAASCCGAQRMIICGNAKVDRKIARDGAESIVLEARRSLPPVLKSLKAEGYQLVGLEQTTNSARLYDFAFVRRTVLVVGHERQGLTQDVLDVLDAVVEIPVYGLPHSHNAATAAAMALYEYCRQFPDG